MILPRPGSRKKSAKNWKNSVFHWGPHFVWGLIFAFVFYIITGLFMYFLHSQSSNSQISGSNFAGVNGIVTALVSPDSVGEIKAIDPITQRTVNFVARSNDVCEVGKNVTIESVMMGTAKIKINK